MRQCGERLESVWKLYWVDDLASVARVTIACFGAAFVLAGQFLFAGRPAVINEYPAVARRFEGRGRERMDGFGDERRIYVTPERIPGRPSEHGRRQHKTMGGENEHGAQSNREHLLLPGRLLVFSCLRY